MRLDDGELRIYADDLSTLGLLGNVDVELVDGQQRRWAATFFSLEGVEALFQKNAVTGECSSGTYLWASDMILLQSLTVETISRTVDDLRKSGEFDQAFALMPEEGDVKGGYAES